MPIGQATNDVAPIIRDAAHEIALRVTNQPHYWRGGILQVSKTDLETDITWEVAKVLQAMLMRVG